MPFVVKLKMETPLEVRTAGLCRTNKNGSKGFLFFFFKKGEEMLGEVSEAGALLGSFSLLG